MNEWILEELLEFLEEVDIIPDEKLNVQAFLMPETGQLLVNPKEVETIDELYFIILHEFCHWAFPELTDDEADINASIWLKRGDVREILNSEVGQPDWMNSLK